jgi:hypothetical protein
MLSNGKYEGVKRWGPQKVWMGLFMLQGGLSSVPAASPWVQAGGEAVWAPQLI